ncbi:slit homolog 1 protein-like isoform X2 [Anneissia japonica]|uniref:slit homolog 1 protein-like isoform X2 n=1 Tax=Anneissia japonica TaxID=1529436 RepID=UPI0014258AB9|nr:slit homolog 1 protein-like isoform X2 [Anneissia japonica]
MAEVSVKILVIYLLVCFSNIVLVESLCRGDSCVCPSDCKCNSTTSTANCSGLNYAVIPENIIDFANQILSRNDFTQVASGAISKDSLVVNLDLSNNKIAKLNNSSFDGAKYLETINLADNQLIALADNAFLKLRNLTNLDLSGNVLESFTALSFEKNMTKMKKLLLRDNKLTTLTDMNSTFPNLQEIDLSGNKLTCDVNMEWIPTWLEIEGNSIKGTCYLPDKLQGRTLDSILPQQFIDAAAIVLPILIILLLVMVGAVLFWKKYWQPRHEDEKKYSAVSREGNTGNRVYSDVTTDL